MAFNITKKLAGGVAGSALLMFGAATAAGSAVAATPAPDRRRGPSATTHVVNDQEVLARLLDQGDAPYVRLANVEGAFTFNQEGTTPNDELFNVFGTALTSMCSKPAVELAESEGGVANFYVNVGGNVKKSFTIDVRELAEDKSQETLMACSCATGAPFGQARVMGVPLSAVVEMADLEDGVNTVTAYGADGFGQPLPLQYALEKNALLVYQVNGEELSSSAGSSLQLWMPETVARYFTRNIVDIELTQEAEEPVLQGMDPCYRNKVNVLNYSDGCVFKAGDEITFEGVADDLGSPVTAVEFSFDGGAHLDVVRDRRSHGGQMGELAVHHHVRGRRRLPHDRAREDRRRRGVPARRHAAVRSGVRRNTARTQRGRRALCPPPRFCAPAPGKAPRPPVRPKAGAARRPHHTTGISVTVASVFSRT